MTGKALPVASQLTPGETLRTFAEKFDFSTQDKINVTYDLTSIGLSCVRSCLVDNSLNPGRITLSIPGSGEKISVPPYAQAIFPIIQVGPSFSVQAESIGGVPVDVQFLNYPQPLQIWYVTAPGEIIGTVPVTGTVSTTPALGSFVNVSGQITAGGSSQQVVAANAARKHFIIQNPTTSALQGVASAEPIWINFGSAATIGTPSIELNPGGSYDTGNGPCPNDAIFVIAATTGHKFTAKQMS